MWWRRTAAEFARCKAEENRKAFRKIIVSGGEPGLLAYVEEEPIGWCAVAPRTEYPRLGRSRILAPIDDLPVWSVTCFFVAKAHRRHGVSRALLKAAVEFVRGRGGTILEGYPTERTSEEKCSPDVFVHTGLASAFRSVGFREVARRSPSRPILRIAVDGSAAPPAGRDSKSHRMQ